MMFSAVSDHHHLAISHSLPPNSQPFPSNLDRINWKPHLESAPNCPRCASSNTKFCYYNNYSLSQPRYFCKACRRYWTKGGSLRNVPVGGGCRKSRRAKSARSVLHQTAAADDRFNPNKVLDGSSTSDTANPTDSGSSADIDLAAVFARFVNSQNNSVSVSDPPSEANAPLTSSSPESFDQLDNLIVENSELFFEELSEIFLNLNEGKQQVHEISTGNKNCAFALENDELWTEEMGMGLPSCSFSWQPYDDQADLDGLASNGNQLKTMTDEYCQGSLDATNHGFEVLSTP